MFSLNFKAWLWMAQRFNREEDLSALALLLCGTPASESEAIIPNALSLRTSLIVVANSNHFV
jgi:hypothetical protein